jgi:hypothetical protein
MYLPQPPEDTPHTASRHSYDTSGEQGTGDIFIGHSSPATWLGPVRQMADQPNGMREPAGIAEDEVKHEPNQQCE